MLENTGTGKENNQERIFALLRRQGSLTKQEIGSALGLSMPTTLQNVNELMEQGILEEGEAVESTGGRRARKIRVNGKAGFCAGIDIATSHVGFTVTNLLGEIAAKKNVPLKFRDEPEVYEQIGGELEEMIRKGRLKNRMLGAGISFPGIIDMQVGWIVQSHIFELEYVSLDRFYRTIPYPLIVENDANCLSFVELSSECSDYVYISLNRTVGGALIQNGQLMTGEGFRAGEVGHMVLVPGGRTCYCGKKGCADAYLSPDALSKGGSLDAFFERLRQGEEETVQVWDTYLDDLAVLATNLRMALDMKIVIGGEVGTYLEPYMGVLQKKALEYDRFARDIDYLQPVRADRREHGGALGAALLAMEKFGSGVLK
ncbi:MAG: ROK family transcriptional regulator [Dorea sp.]|jgi:predicted NBD/HSP70 family sugar kinase|nr:ROK family transcriptional regulator [Dorea sp.]